MKKFLIKIVVNVLFFVGDILSKLPDALFFYWHPLYTYLMCKSYDIQKKYLGGNSPWELEKECEIDIYFKRDYPELAKAFEDASEVVRRKNSNNYISDSEKIEMYEKYIFDLELQCSMGNREKVSHLLENACKFSYAHRVGNGELTEDERVDIIKKYFENLRRYPDDTKTSEPSHSDGSCQEKNDPESGTVSEGDREV